MKYFKIIALLGIVLILLVGVYLVSFRGGDEPITDDTIFNNFPISEDVDVDLTTGIDAESSLTMLLRDGRSVAVRDFTKDEGVTQSDTGEGVAYQYSDSVELEDKFVISYYENSNGILIWIGAQPLRENRAAAEAKLLQMLNANEEDVCELNISVSTSIAVSEEFAGRELGLSFCEGSESLF